MQQFGDEGHRNGWCLYQMGCKGPETYNNCSLKHFGDVDGAWPIGTGHPCFGCSEYGVAFNKPLHETAEVLRLTPSAAFPAVDQDMTGGISPWATGVAGAIGGAAIGGAAMASRKLGQYDPEMEEVKPAEGQEG